MADMATIGAAIASTVVTLGTLAGGAYAWWLKHQRAEAQTRAEVAESNADRTVADAQSTVYKLLTNRLAALENEMAAVRTELATERGENRRLMGRIWQLEGLMHKAGIDIPPFVDGPTAAPSSGMTL